MSNLAWWLLCVICFVLAAVMGLVVGWCKGFNVGFQHGVDAHDPEDL